MDGRFVTFVITDDLINHECGHGWPLLDLVIMEDH